MDFATLALRDYAADLAQEDSTPALSSQMMNRTTVRRCRTRAQGSALLIVGHAIEYLMESRLIHQTVTSGAEREALAILLRANLLVYNEGTEVMPMAMRLRRWFHGGSAERRPAGAHS